jgi:hypothetical protein
MEKPFGAGSAREISPRLFGASIFIYGKRRLRDLLSIALTAGLLSIPTVTLSQDTQAPEGSDAFVDETALISLAVDVCSEGETLAQCPNECVTACKSVAFLRENTDGCEAALVSAPGSDDASCPAIEAPRTESLVACIERSRSVPRKPGRVIERNSERLALFNAFFSDRPACAASTLGLEAMFSCLGGETDLVEREYDALGSLEIGDDPLSATELRELACSLDEDRLIEVDIGASALRSRASGLSERLGEVANCRNAYATWLDERGAFCQQSDGGFANCEATINVFQVLMEESLSGAAEQNRLISGVVDRLERDLDAITSLALVSTTCR